MATTPNQKPVPSEDYANMRFNAGKFDEFMTSTASSYVDRLGITHLTVKGIQASVTGALLTANNLSDVQSSEASLTNLGATTIGSSVFTATSAANARTAILAAVRGANSDITSLTGLTTPLSTAQGGTGNATGLAATATALATARTFSTNLASTTAASFSGTANVTQGVTGTLPITNGGTGATTLVAAKTSLDIFPNTGQITGTAAAAGKIGEILTNTLSSVAITSGIYSTVASVTLSAGEWVVYGVANVSGSGTTYSYVNCGISTAAASNAFPYEVGTTFNGNQASTNITFPVSSRSFSITASTVIYLIVVAGVGAGTATGKGYLEARRVR